MFQVKDYVKKMDSVEKEVNAVLDDMVTKSQLELVKNDLLKVMVRKIKTRLLPTFPAR